MVSAKVFVSSVILGLEKEREAVEQIIQSLGLIPNRFEVWPAHPEKPPERCLDEVEDSEVYILILGDKISDITIAEYETARALIPNRILVFVKDIDRTDEAEEFYNQIKEECSYNTFSDVNDLRDNVKNAIQSLLYQLLTIDKDTTPLLEEEILLEKKRKSIQPRETLKYQFNLNYGDEIHGIVDEVDGDIINVYFLSEKNYIKRKNDEEFDYFGEEEIGACPIDTWIEDEGMWYLLIKNNAIRIPREVYIRISVKR
jgi:hypothetical protein